MFVKRVVRNEGWWIFIGFDYKLGDIKVGI